MYPCKMEFHETAAMHIHLDQKEYITINGNILFLLHSIKENNVFLSNLDYLF